jgi:hypothetical protein
MAREPPMRLRAIRKTGSRRSFLRVGITLKTTFAG